MKKFVCVVTALAVLLGLTSCSMNNGVLSKVRTVQKDSEWWNDSVTMVTPDEIKVAVNDSDLYIAFDKTKMRFDMLSYKYYGDPDYAWLILQANPHLGGYEYSIRHGEILRIPYPLSSALNRYEMAAITHQY